MIEVTFALGLLSFMLLAIIGLMSAGLDSCKAAHVATRTASTVRLIQAIIRTDVPNALVGTSYFFNYDGSTNAGPSGAYFQCAITTNQPATNVSATDFVGVVVKVSYPLAAPIANRTTNIFHASVAR